MTPAELRDFLGGHKPADDREARSRRFVADVLDANPDGPSAAAELEAAAVALRILAGILRGP